jgi:hypothetical protein
MQKNWKPSVLIQKLLISKKLFISWHCPFKVSNLSKSKGGKLIFLSWKESLKISFVIYTFTCNNRNLTFLNIRNTESLDENEAEVRRKLVTNLLRRYEHLKGQEHDMVFWPFHSPSCLERAYLEVFWIWPVINQGREWFCSLGAVGECAKHAYAPFPNAHYAFFLIS